jgi:hypothetical protein
MSAPEPSIQNASRLVYKSLHAHLSPANDTTYRELIALARAVPEFRQQVEEVATGMELRILDISEVRGVVCVAATAESRFAVRLADMRAGMDLQQKCALVLAHVAIAAVFFPTTDVLDDDSYTPPPASIAACRETLYALAKRLKEATELPPDIPVELAPGWESICALPQAMRGAQRASVSSVDGAVKIALNQMAASGLVRLDRNGDDDASTAYTATHRLRVQLRELALRRLYEMAQRTVTGS